MGFTGRGSRYLEKDEGSNQSQSGDLKLLPAQLKPRHILTHVGSRVEVFCERFDTQKGRPFGRPFKSIS